MNQMIAPLRKRPPVLSKAQVNSLLIHLTGQSRLDIGDFKELPSYADRNYHFRLGNHLESDQGDSLQEYNSIGQTTRSYILKILSCPDQESYDLACARIGVMRHLHNARLKCPDIIRLKNQKLMQTVQLPQSQQQHSATDDGKNTFVAYLLTFIEGQTLSTIQPSNNLLYQIGKYAGLIAKNLQVKLFSIYLHDATIAVSVT